MFIVYYMSVAMLKSEDTVMITDMVLELTF